MPDVRMRGRRTGDDDFLAAVESVSKGIDDPVSKLRYIRGSLERFESADSVVRVVPFAPLRRRMYRWLNLERVRPLLGHRTLSRNYGVTLDEPHTPRRWARSTKMACATALLLAVAGAALRFSRAEPPGVQAAAPVAASAPRAASTPTEPLPVLPNALAPAAVWLVEKGTGFEQYSNGLRVDTTYAVHGEPRSFRIFDAQGGMSAQVFHKPVGILFHTSESDVWPLEASFNENLRDSSQHLLRYLARERSYNFLVDRFGRVYRVVDEETKANHAGHSIWEDEGRIFLNLNSAFIGVSFESRWDGGRALPITQAQLAAGRTLTEWLRQQYEIAPRLCVTHGLTSVNPKKHLIGHHLDWARGFPFEAFGVPDQYHRPAPSVALFGFGYDDDFLKVLGEPWPGVGAAERALATDAGRQGRTVEQIRRERQALYDRWLEEQTRDQEAVTSTARTEQAQGRGPGG
jgi:hypothetical protein